MTEILRMGNQVQSEQDQGNKERLFHLTEQTRRFPVG